MEEGHISITVFPKRKETIIRKFLLLSSSFHCKKLKQPQGETVLLFGRYIVISMLSLARKDLETQCNEECCILHQRPEKNNMFHRLLLPWRRYFSPLLCLKFFHLAVPVRISLLRPLSKFMFYDWNPLGHTQSCKCFIISLFPNGLLLPWGKGPTYPMHFTFPRLCPGLDTKQLACNIFVKLTEWNLSQESSTQEEVLTIMLDFYFSSSCWKL